MTNVNFYFLQKITLWWRHSHRS